MRWFTVPPAGGAIPFPMTSHLHKTGFSVVTLIKKKGGGLHENQQEQEMSLAVPSPILKSEKLYSPLVNNSGLFTKIKIVSFNLWVFLFPTATKFLRRKYLSRLD